MLVSGLVVHSLAAFDMTIRTRLLAALCGFFLCTVLNAVVGFFASKTANNGLQSIHDGRVVALRDLKIVVDMYAVNIVDASHKVRNGNFTYEEGLAAVLEAKQKIEKHWAQFSSAGARPDVEAAAIREVARTSVDADATTGRLLTALNQRDAAALDRLVRTELYQTIDPVSEAMSKLVDLQLAGPPRPMTKQRPPSRGRAGSRSPRSPSQPSCSPSRSGQRSGARSILSKR